MDIFGFKPQPDAMVSTLQRMFGARVRHLRKAAGFSQEGFASRADIDRATYGKLERGLVNATLLTMARIAVALDLDLATLLDGVPLDADEIRSTPRSARGSGSAGSDRTTP